MASKSSPGGQTLNQVSPELLPYEEKSTSEQGHTQSVNRDVEQQVLSKVGEGSDGARAAVTKTSAFKSLGLLDRLLALWILLAMVIGIILGNFVPNIGLALQKGKFVGVSVPIGEQHSRFRLEDSPANICPQLSDCSL